MWSGEHCPLIMYLSRQTKPYGKSSKVMATTIIKFITAAFFLSFFIIQGYSDECSLSKINIGTERSGREIEGKPEWNVSVINNCVCAQSQIKLSCQGFQTTETVDPSILSMEGDNCILINGNPLQASASVHFSYAWDPPFLLLPIHSVIGDCA
ncbi:hypothetical protein L6164_005784 [Bauhinia variegata]|uniref:Uncharacterized protein n=1 Tax=Bauhinia variegata TaxID=167791 RepID=A0ACB9PRK2_BAUVA|nr:hypothetical protein L6164_005784 [Bauhinia variegata]